MVKTNNRIRNCCISILLSVISVLLMHNAYSSALNKRVLLVMGAVCVVWMCFGLFSTSFDRLIEKCINASKKMYVYVLEHRKKTLLYGIGIAAIICMAKVLETALASIIGIQTSYILFCTVLSVILIGYTVYRYRHDLYDKMHMVFFVCSIICGLFYIVCSPTEVVMGWDEHIHFDNVNKIVDTIGGYSLEVNQTISSHVYEPDDDYFSSSKRNENDLYYDQLYDEGVLVQYDSMNVQATTISYVPYAVGMIVGRGLMLPYHVTFRLSKFMNYLLYSLLVTLAIKHSKSHKAIYAGIGTLPTVMFMASSFAYDQWVISFSLLGYSLYQESLERGTMNRNDALKIGICFFLGLLVKAVYFPIMIPMLWAPNEIFKDKKQKRCFQLFVITLMVLLLMSFALPMLIDSGVQTDIRGGSDVNSSEQVKFILSNPIQYAIIYFRYLFTFYLSPNHLYGFITAFAYIGNGSKSVISAIILFATVLFSKNNGYSNVKNGVITWLSCFFSLTLVVTALYVSFTPVGLDTVNGCQFRYLIPLLYPVMSSLGGGVKNLSRYSGIYGTFVMIYMTLSMLLYMSNYLCCLY